MSDKNQQSVQESKVQDSKNPPKAFLVLQQLEKLDNKIKEKYVRRLLKAQTTNNFDVIKQIQFELRQLSNYDQIYSFQIPNSDTPKS
jgi:hypothetical protein